MDISAISTMHPAEYAVSNGGLGQGTPVFTVSDEVNISQEALAASTANAETISTMDQAVRDIADAFSLANEVVSGMMDDPVAAAAAQSSGLNLGSAIGKLA